MSGGQRSKRKKSSEVVATQPLSNWTNVVSAAPVALVAPGLSRANRPGNTERDSGNGNQHLLPAHRNLRSYVAAALSCGRLAAARVQPGALNGATGKGRPDACLTAALGFSEPFGWPRGIAGGTRGHRAHTSRGEHPDMPISGRLFQCAIPDTRCCRREESPCQPGAVSEVCAGHTKALFQRSSGGAGAGCEAPSTTVNRQSKSGL